MAYESSIPFADIRDFREAEINGIPALFTMSRLDSETLPADFHSCEVMGGRRMRGNMTVNAGEFSTFLKELVNTGYIKISTGPGTWEKDIFGATTFVPILCEKV